MGRPLKFPTHTATVNPPVVPTAQLSVKCRLVPAFTATGNGKSNGVSSPNPGMRAHGSMKGPVVVARAIGSSRRLVRVRDVGEDRGRRVAPVERERVEERLERGSRLPWRHYHIYLTHAVRPEIG